MKHIVQISKIINHANAMFTTIFSSMHYSWPAKIGHKNIHLCPLLNSDEHATGYQNVAIGPENEEGLLFVFDSEKPRVFHMENVGFDLDLLGFNAEGRLVCIIPMCAGEGAKYKTLPCKYIVEAPRGWGSDLDIGVAKLNLEPEQLQEINISHSIMARIVDRPDVEEHVFDWDSPANFVRYGWLDLDKDGIMDIYQMPWYKFDPTDMNNNKGFRIKEEEKIIGDLARSKRDKHLANKKKK